MQTEEAIRLSAKKLLSAAIRNDKDKARFNAILEAEHYLGARQPSGNTVYQVIKPLVRVHDAKVQAGNVT